jgi:hypothetical protein
VWRSRKVVLVEKVKPVLQPTVARSLFPGTVSASYLSVLIYQNTCQPLSVAGPASEMSYQPLQNSRDDLQHDDEDESTEVGSSRSTWRAVWQNNKGMFLILLAEMAGSSMDAIVRFLQQGGRSMHPFQVGVPNEKTT